MKYCGKFFIFVRCCSIFWKHRKKIACIPKRNCCDNGLGKKIDEVSHLSLHHSIIIILYSFDRDIVIVQLFVKDGINCYKSVVRRTFSIIFPIKSYPKNANACVVSSLGGGNADLG